MWCNLIKKMLLELFRNRKENKESLNRWKIGICIGDITAGLPFPAYFKKRAYLFFLASVSWICESHISDQLKKTTQKKQHGKSQKQKNNRMLSSLAQSKAKNNRMLSSLAQSKCWFVLLSQSAAVSNIFRQSFYQALNHESWIKVNYTWNYNMESFHLLFFLSESWIMNQTDKTLNPTLE